MQKLNKIISNNKKVFNKISKYCKENKRKALMTVVLIIAVFVVLLNTSFGYFNKRIEGTKLSFNVGTLNYELDCLDLENCEITIPANDSKTFDISLTSKNKIDTKYELYYEVISPTSTENIIDGGHLLTEDLSNIGEIEKNETKNIALVANNTGSDAVTIKLGVAPSLKSDNATLEETQISLNIISHQKYYVYDYTGNYETFTAPVNGVYKIELWGAQGGGSGGAGGYTSGYLNLISEDEFYVYVGSTTSNGTGGYNGGGSVTGNVYGGGGSTDFRTISGVWNNTESLKSRIMVAAGGGGKGNGYAGGIAGGLTGGNGTGDDPGYGATQTSAGTGNSSTGGGNGGFGFGGTGGWGSEGLGGGGSGYYGGSSGAGTNNNGSGGGGSSFISGYKGCNAINNDGSHKGTPIHYSDIAFSTPIMKAGNQEMPTHDLNSTQNGNIGNGYARITLVTIGEDNGYVLTAKDNPGTYYEITANTSKNIELSITNTNQESSYYELYYKVASPVNTENKIDGGYLSYSSNTSKELIEAGETKKVNIVINNTGTDTIYVLIDAKKYNKIGDTQIEEPIKSLNKEIIQKYYTYDYTGNYETFKVYTAGIYKVELWGAQGGGSGGAGGYTSGYLNLNPEDEFYVYVGSTTSNGTGGYNGGGSVTGNVYGGGGSTDFRTISGVWNNTESLKSRIMVAAGGGGKGNGYAGGIAGGLTGGNGAGSDPGYGATQTAGGTGNSSTGGGNGGFGFGGTGGWSGESLGGGGSGYYGGSSGAGQDNNGSGGGGSSFISGYEGCNAINADGKHNGTPIHFSNIQFNNPEMKSGNQEILSHDLNSSQTGNTGDGYARITFITNDGYTIKYNANGGVGSMEDSQAFVNSMFALSKNTFTKDGYLFKGWSLSADSDEVAYKNMESIINLTEKDKTITLYAVWIDKYTVTFDVNGGNTLTENSKVVNVSSAYGTLPTPTKDAYDFIGWYTEKEGGKQITEDTLVTEITETLYARWKARTLDVLAYVGASSIYREGGGTYTSPTFDITNFNKLEVSCGYGQTGGGGAYSAYLVTTSGNISLLGTKTVDISGYTGNAYISISTTKVSMSGWDPSLPYDEWGETNSYWKSSGYVNLTRLFLSA